MSKINLNDRVLHEVAQLVASVYPNENSLTLATQLVSIFTSWQPIKKTGAHENHWDQKDVVLITYADSILPNTLEKPMKRPLQTLHNFLQVYLKEVISSVHILPFYPYSSDDGFSVINYSQVNESVGQWADITAISKEYKVMADLVINHCSARSLWFENFKQGRHPGKDFFIEAQAEFDHSKVVRPRTSNLFKTVQTSEGKKQVWCTFSHDQVDLNFANPALLLEMAKVIVLYLQKGITIFRLDAVAFLWKQSGTRCINLQQTHVLIRMLRLLIESVCPNAVIITETNIPNSENLTYFGNANEAHCIYNFSLPPLLIDALLNARSDYLKQWMMSMPPAQNGTCYFNFIASHDGIGLRPAEGLLSEKEINQLVNTTKAYGGQVSMRTDANNQSKPYELNITLFDLMQGDSQGPDQFQLQRFVCAHAIMFALEGMIGLYIHSMFACQNDDKKVEHTNSPRSINRHRWQENELLEVLHTHTHHQQAFERIKQLLHIRRLQPAFHPNATQFTLHLNTSVFGFWRQCMQRKQSIFCLYNLSKQKVTLPLANLNLISTERWQDLLTQTPLCSSQQTIELAPYQAYWLSNVF